MILLLLIVTASGLKTVFGQCKDGKILALGLNCDQKQFIVDLHNKYRDLVAGGGVDGQSKAANMIELRWNDAVAKKAQSWANGCMFGHDPNLTLDDMSLGQNIAIMKSSADIYRTANLTNLIKLWFDEVYKYGYDGTFNYNSGHYSQMIWGNTRYVGCGLVYYKDNDGFYNSYLVCNYSPPGNIIGVKPYKEGETACIKNGLVESTSYKNLCAYDKKKVRACG